MWLRHRQAHDVWVMPMSLAQYHWVLFVVDVKQRTVSVIDSDVNSGAAVGRDTATSMLVQWLGEHVVGSGKAWTASMMSIPQQGDGYSCGVHVMRYMDSLSFGNRLRVERFDVQKYRRTVLVELVGYLGHT